MNNPLKYTDPSGHFFKKLFSLIIKGFKKQYLEEFSTSDIISLIELGEGSGNLEDQTVYTEAGQGQSDRIEGNKTAGWWSYITGRDPNAEAKAVAAAPTVQQDQVCSDISVIILAPYKSETRSAKSRMKDVVAHAAVGVEDELFDYGPLGDYAGALRGGPGGRYWAKQFGTEAVSFEKFIAGIGRLTKDLDTVYKVSIKATEEEASTVKAYWYKLYSKETRYLGYWNQCTTNVAASLRAANLTSTRFVFQPETLLKSLQSDFKHTCGDNKGKNANIEKIVKPFFEE